MRPILYFPKYSLIIGLTSLLVLLVGYDFYQSFNYTLRGMHIWRQADCLSIATCYKLFDIGLFEPRLFNLGSTGTGRAISDFPILYWLGSIFPDNALPKIFRVFNFTVLTVGVLLVFKTVENAFRNTWISLGLLILLFTSPAIVFYSNNYLMNVPALGFALIGYFFGSRYIQSFKKSELVFASLFFLFAALLKVTALIHFVLFFEYVILLVVFRKTKPDSLTPLILSALLIGVCVSVWIAYARYYNSVNHSGAFLVGILPFWDLSWTEIQQLGKEIFLRKQDLFNPLLFYTWVGAVVLSIIQFVKNYRSFSVIYPILFLTYSGAFVIYVALFYQVLNQHDYYFINWIPVFVGSLLIYYQFLPSIKAVRIVFMLAILFLITDSFLLSQNRISDRYSGWKGADYNEFLKYFEDDFEHEFKPGEKVYVPQDRSINASLFLLQAEGWTGYNKLLENGSLDHYVQTFKLEYIVVFDNEDRSAIEKQLSQNVDLNLYKKFGKFRIYRVAN